MTLNYKKIDIGTCGSYGPTYRRSQGLRSDDAGVWDKFRTYQPNGTHFRLLSFRKVKTFLCFR